MPSRSPGQYLPEISEEVAKQIRGEFPDGEKVLSCLRTAGALLARAMADDSGLRYLESAAYNLRQAFDGIVRGRRPAEDHFSAVLRAWKIYDGPGDESGEDRSAAFADLVDALRRASKKQDRQKYYTNLLIGYLEEKNGSDRLSGDLDPAAEYQRLRDAASDTLHGEATLTDVSTLYEKTIAWFNRMFTPPDTVVRELRALAAEPWSGPSQIERLRTLTSSQHHLRQFFARLTDPGWLLPLHDARIATVPEPGSPWPVAGVVTGLGQSAPAQVAVLLERLLAECEQAPKEDRWGPSFELLRVASMLGAAGHQVIAKVYESYPASGAVRALAVDAAREGDPRDQFVERVADLAVTGNPLDNDRYYYNAVLSPLIEGTTEDNVAARGRMLAAKVRRIAKHPHAQWVVLDVARLTAGLDDEDRHYLIIVVHYLARLLARAQAFGVPAAEVLTWTAGTPGEVGGRLTCRILAGADDVALRDKISHVTERISSMTATGDDKDLVDDVLAADPESDLLADWSTALGTPSAPPAGSTAALPRDWERAWRWSVVLPGYLMASWREPIARVTDKHGVLGATVFDQRIPRSSGQWRQSPHTVEELSALPVLDAARLVGSWRPGAEDHGQVVGARELARTLEAAVEADPAAWAADAESVVTALREPVHVLHYFRAMTTKADEVAPRTPSIISAAILVRTWRWTPTVLGNDNFDFEPGWHNVDVAAVELAASLADADAPIQHYLDIIWTWVLDLIDLAAPTDADTSFADRDALTHAINHPRGRGLQAALSLGWWEHRATGSARPSFTALLDDVVHAGGQAGRDYLAILAQRRVILEIAARDWLERNLTTLFGDNPPGREAFDLTLKYGRRATAWFYEHLRDQLVAAVLRGSEQATNWLVLATVHEVPGYGVADVVGMLRGNTDALSAAAGDIAFLVQDEPADAPTLVMAVAFWRSLLEADGNLVPPESLRACGRWAFVDGIAHDTWATLMLVTLEHTDGAIDYHIEVANRCRTAPIPGTSTRILLHLLDHGEPWEREYIAQAALEALRTISSSRSDENFDQLRTRLIDLGYDDATDIEPYPDTPGEQP